MSYDKQLLKASYFPLLFHENFRKLDLSRCHSMITDQVLKLVCLRCKVIIIQLKTRHIFSVLYIVWYNQWVQQNYLSSSLYHNCVSFL